MLIDKWDYRIADVSTAARRFIEESKYPITFDEDNNAKYLWGLFNDPESAIIVNYKDNVFAGAAILTRDTESHKEFFGYIVKFYVMPEARGTGVARELMQEVVQWFDNTDCVVSFAQATANIGQDRRFANLLKKVGYVELGSNLIRNQYGKSKKDNQERH